MSKQESINNNTLVERWREVRDDLSAMFKERQIDFAKAAERFEYALHEDDVDYEFSYERVKKFWKKPPKGDASKNDCPEISRLPKALEYLTNLREYLLEKEGLVVGKKNSDSKRRLIQKIGIDGWNIFQKLVVERVEQEEMN
ncbi:MAG: hypothetical protein J6W54_06465 [Fibrobacter sp.]|uniref:hypothetical protein n=1 Tax=Fibrobacter sp. TaxID=35828 RepID=UPI001B2DFC57|nr:hypothetical protein [Fibrobacter sp.]MBO7060719.1 hypothetical protein [Fibrobacter sp.]